MVLSAQKHAAGLQRRQMSVIKAMAVGGKYSLALQEEQTVICHDWKVKHHLFHLGFTVAADAEQVLLFLIQHGRRLSGIIILWQIIARAVLEQVSPKQKLLRCLPLKRLHKPLAAGGGAMYIRCDHQFQSYHSFPVCLTVCRIRICALSMEGARRTAERVRIVFAWKR